jgi:ribosomal protein L37E
LTFAVTPATALEEIMVNLVKMTPQILVVLATLVLWTSFAWGLPADVPADEGGAEVTAAEDTWRCGNCGAENVAAAKYCTECGAKRADKAGVGPKDPWAGAMISAAYDHAKCPQCGKKNEVRAETCARCGDELPQPSTEFTYPPWVFVPGKGYYREGTLLEPPIKRKGFIITGYALIAVGAAAVIGAAAYEGENEEPVGYLGFFGGATIGGAGGVLLIIGYATWKEPIYAFNRGGLYENGPRYTYAQRPRDYDAATLKVEVTALGF